MATKYQLITGLYESTIQSVTETPAAWTAFLRSACRNYKCRFDEQILIYAQRPEAMAVLEIEKWNEQFGRWVNKGARGIAVFDDGYNGNYRLKHYFDISDTHGSRFERPVPLWSMKPEYESDVIESLENSFGEIDDKSNSAKALISTARNAVEDNISDYFSELMYIREYSFLEEYDNINLEVRYRIALENSVAYMLLTRCGIDADKYFDADDFLGIIDFNTLDTANTLGIATSDISEMCLREIAVTVRNLQGQEKNINRTFALQEDLMYNVPDKQNNERSVENGREIDVSAGGRLSNTELDSAGRTSRNSWQIRVTPKEIPQGEPQDSVRESADGGYAQPTSDGNRADGAGTKSGISLSLVISTATQEPLKPARRSCKKFTTSFCYPTRRKKFSDLLVGLCKVQNGSGF